MNILYFDIETLPGSERPSLEEVEAKAPKNMKKPETIRAWAEENQEAEWRKQALDSMAGQVLAIGFALNDAETSVLIQGRDGIESERDLLARFQDILIDLNMLPDFCGHNIKTFDLPWIWRKAVQHRLNPLCNMIPRARYDPRIKDTMELWAADFKDHVSLDAIAHFLGLQGKVEGMDGSQVLDLYEAGELDRIAEYCAGDVRTVRSVYLALIGEF
jgi:hypothetical protein